MIIFRSASRPPADVAAAKRHASFQAFPDLQIGLGVHSVNPLVIGNGTIAPPHHIKSPVADSTSLRSEILKPLQ